VLQQFHFADHRERDEPVETRMGGKAGGAQAEVEFGGRRDARRAVQQGGRGGIELNVGAGVGDRGRSGGRGLPLDHQAVTLRRNVFEPDGIGVGGGDGWI
jgi:hypothetical protein